MRRSGSKGISLRIRTCVAAGPYAGGPEAPRNRPTHGRDSSPGHRAPSCRGRHAHASRLRLRPIPSSRRRPATRARQRAKEIYSAQFRTNPHNSAPFRTGSRDSGHPQRVRWPCGSGARPGTRRDKRCRRSRPPCLRRRGRGGCGGRISGEPRLLGMREGGAGSFARRGAVHEAIKAVERLFGKRTMARTAPESESDYRADVEQALDGRIRFGSRICEFAWRRSARSGAIMARSGNGASRRRQGRAGRRRRPASSPPPLR